MHEAQVRNAGSHGSKEQRVAKGNQDTWSSLRSAYIPQLWATLPAFMEAGTQANGFGLA